MGLHVQALQDYRALESKLSVEMKWKRRTAKQLLELREHAPSLAAQADKVSFFLSACCYTPMGYCAHAGMLNYPSGVAKKMSSTLSMTGALQYRQTKPLLAQKIAA